MGAAQRPKPEEEVAEDEEDTAEEEPKLKRRKEAEKAGGKGGAKGGRGKVGVSTVPAFDNQKRAKKKAMVAASKQRKQKAEVSNLPVLYLGTKFRAGETWFLIATDVMARGMDFIGINTVLNFDFPHDAFSYIHRIGRSGRGGRPGTAITLFTEDDAGQLRTIANVMHASGCEVPAWMLSLDKARKHRKALGFRRFLKYLTDYR
eukprot:gene5585-6772_t